MNQAMDFHNLISWTIIYKFSSHDEFILNATLNTLTRTQCIINDKFTSQQKIWSAMVLVHIIWPSIPHALKQEKQEKLIIIFELSDFKSIWNQFFHCAIYSIRLLIAQFITSVHKQTTTTFESNEGYIHTSFVILSIYKSQWF